MRKITIRPASREDIAAFSDEENKPTIKAFCAELDGKIIGLGGVALEKGRFIAFADLPDEIRPYKMTIMRWAKRFFEQARKDGIRFIYADANPNEPKSVAWLKSLGFERDHRSKRLYRWKS